MIGIRAMLFVFLKVILLTDCRLSLLVLMGEVGLEAWAEVDVPAPETAPERLGTLLIMRPELTGLAGIMLLCHNAKVLIS
jgi:hypothetical protein